MAGKHIYIETILDNLLGGFQTTFDKMIAALDRMIGKTEEDPDGTSLKNVVAGLEEITGKTEEDPGKNLSEVVTELEAVVASIAASAAVINVKPGQNEQVVLPNISISGSSATVEKKIKCNAQGTLTFSGDIALGYYGSTAKYGNFYLYVNELEIAHYREYIATDSPKHITHKIVVSKDDLIRIVCSTENSSVYSIFNNGLLEYDLGASLDPEDIFVEV